MHFSDKLVLSQWLLSLLGIEETKTIADFISAPEFEGWAGDGQSRFLNQLLVRLPSEESRQIKDAELRDADLQVVAHWKHITARRNIKTGQTLYPLYFQYLALIATEFYLARYFQAPANLVAALNGRVAKFNAEIPKAHQLPDYEESDLNKLAFWMATGSGKTLIMHCQLRQYLYHIGKAGKRASLNKIILLTPNEGLSVQHLAELEESDIEAALFDKDGSDNLFTGRGVDIIDIHKLADKSGDKTVAVDSFEGNNLVLVDEGHRGSGGDAWMERRAKLCADGFSFEYSATFGQAIKAATGAKKKKLEHEYARCIAFDYSYKYFYGDGYGKDFHILNLQEEQEDETRPLYLTACLLGFFQQCLRFGQETNTLKPYGLADPLLIFVGRSVLSSGSTLTAEGKKTAADMVEILLFLARFIGDRQATERRLCLLLQKKSDLIAKGHRIFDDFFPLVGTRYSPDATGAAKLYKDILANLFNASSGGTLHAVHLTGSDGEIGLRVGATNDYFGVVNVGESKKLCDLLEEEKTDADNLTVDSQPFSHSLFADINRPGSPIRLLMGSKKFTEGWSSWRVSTMGFMNIGKKEGSEIIQLFGRGVRLKGYQFTLKRSSRLDPLHYRDGDGKAMIHPEHIELLETLNIFGVRSDYMKEFEEYLEEEGLGDEDRPQLIVLPTIKTLARTDLKILGRKPDAPEFKKEEKLWLESLEGELTYKVHADWYPRLESQKSRGSTSPDGAAINLTSLTEIHLAFVNWDEVYFALEEHKRQKALYNILFSPEILRELAHKSWWYTLAIPANFLEFGGSFSRTRLWQEIVTGLLKGYLDRFYSHHKNNFDAPYLEIQQLKADAPSFITEYRALVKKSEVALIQQLTDLAEKFKGGDLAELSLGQMEVFGFGNHLYHPLISVTRDQATRSIIKVSPVDLNPGEKDFVLHLKDFCGSAKGQALAKEYDIYLLRNQSRGTGFGYFQNSGFYPDFLLWLVRKDGHQFVTFLDPKGLRSITDHFNNPKVKFYEQLAKLEAEQLNDDKLALNSFLVSNSHQHDLKWPSPSNPHNQASLTDYHDHHVYFQKDNPDTYVEELVNAIIS